MNYTYDDITFIIPIKIDSPTRLNNLYFSLFFLSKIHNFKIILKEVDEEQKIKNITNEFDNLNIKYIFEKQTTDFFHRTKYLNDMLEMCDTKIICNFDCDVILPKNNIDESLNLFNKGMDVVYPYGVGFNLILIEQYDQIKEIKTSNCIKENFHIYESKLNSLTLPLKRHSTLFGHAVMLKTDSYKKAFGENELFKSYGPEDWERYARFVKLKLNVSHLNINSNNVEFHDIFNRIGPIDNITDKLVILTKLNALPFTYHYFHMEHPRNSDSNAENKYFKFNEELFANLKKLSYDELIKTYNNFDYVKERKFNK